MSSQQKRGFRLPWAVERSTEEGAAAATLEAESAESTTPDRIEDGVGDDLGEGPFHFADGSSPEASTDASPEAPDVPETTAEAAMIESESATTESPEAAPTADHDAWPDADQRTPAAAASEPTAEAEPTTTALPPIRVEGESRTTRANPLVAGLVKAMREAAQASRDETTAQLQGEATARTEAIREAATGKAAELRKHADDDIAGIREWSKSEIARLRQETEERIERRKADLAEQTEQLEAHVEHQVEKVKSTVTSFEADMDQFFDRLLAENDPAQLAALAEQAPEPPDLSAQAFSVDVEFAAASAGGEWGDVAWGGGSLGADAAAQAEAAATEGLDLSEDNAWPASVLAAARKPDAPTGDFEAAGVANSRLSVNGLTSVAGISAFKGALSQLSGVRSVSVSSGEPGVFIFTVVHSAETDIQGAVAGLTAFSARVTDASGDTLTVVAHEPAA